MSAEPDQPASSGGGRFSTLIGSLTGSAPASRTARADEAAQADQDMDADQANQTARADRAADADEADDWQAPPPRPTFTARTDEPPTAVTPGPAGVPAQADAPEPGSSWDRVRRTPAADATPPAAVPPVPETPARTDPDGPALPDEALTGPDAPALPDGEGAQALSQPAAAVDEPLLGDVAGLRARWQRVQAGFIDDPQEAVGDAADLIEQTAQALVGALRQRQRQLRVMWEGGPHAAADGDPAARATDTEHLRLMMHRYRALFNELCRP